MSGKIWNCRQLQIIGGALRIKKADITKSPLIYMYHGLDIGILCNLIFWYVNSWVHG